MKFDIFKLVKNVPHPKLKNKILDYTFSWAIPFNKGLGLTLKKVSPTEVSVSSSPLKKRQNHVGGAHACFLALMGEYAAGLCLAQNFSPAQYRMIIGSLRVTYHKQGRSALTSTSVAPDNLSELKQIQSQKQEELWVTMISEITDEKAESIATCETQWQIKNWDHVRS